VPDCDEFDFFRLSKGVGNGKGFFARNMKDKFSFFILKASD
jgi:hypothetical protein